MRVSRFDTKYNLLTLIHDTAATISSNRYSRRLCLNSISLSLLTRRSFMSWERERGICGHRCFVSHLAR